MRRTCQNWGYRARIKHTIRPFKRKSEDKEDVWTSLPVCKYQGKNLNDHKIRDLELADLVAEIERLGDMVGLKPKEYTRNRSVCVTIIRKYIIKRHDLGLLCPREERQGKLGLRP